MWEESANSQSRSVSRPQSHIVPAWVHPSGVLRGSGGFGQLVLLLRHAPEAEDTSHATEVRNLPREKQRPLWELLQAPRTDRPWRWSGNGGHAGNQEQCLGGLISPQEMTGLPEGPPGAAALFSLFRGKKRHK